MLHFASLPSRHVAAEDLVDAAAKCPACLDGGRRREVLTLQRDPRVTLVECARCRGCSASHVPTAEHLARFYASFYAGMEAHTTFDGARRFARHLGRRLRLDPSGGVRILDFGGGDGSLAIALAEALGAPRRDVSVTLVDPHVAATATAAGIPIERAASLDEVDGRFDVVLASGVLEHLAALHDSLRSLVRCLASGGWLYARTPWHTPLARLLPFTDLSFPAHLHDLGAPFWNRIATALGLPVVVLESRPSVRQAGFARQPLRALAAAAAKAPGRLESLLSPASRADRWWPYVGGWEVLLQRLPDS